MKAIAPHERKIANIGDEAAWTAYSDVGVAEAGTSFIQLNGEAGRGVGFYIYRMAPGARSIAHRHGGAEEFVMIEGELIDNDGTVYKAGDVVWLAAGTEHFSYTKTGCIIAVYAEAEEEAPRGAE